MRLLAAKNELKELDPAERQFFSNVFLAMKGKEVYFEVGDYSPLSSFTTEIGIVICSLPSLRKSCSRNVIYSTIPQFFTLQTAHNKNSYFFII